MFELYSYENKIPKEKYDVIHKIILDNYFEVHPEINKDEYDYVNTYNTWVNTILNTKDYYILLYYIDNKIIGFVAFMYKDDYLWLSEVEFNMNYKNKGYLKTLLKKVIDISDKSRYSKVIGQINPKNTLSRAVFTHIGLVNTYKNRFEISLDNLLKWLNK